MIAPDPCPCGGTYQEHRVIVRIARAGDVVEIDDVPQGRCETCGGRVYTAAVLKHIEAVFKAETSTVGGRGARPDEHEEV